MAVQPAQPAQTKAIRCKDVWGGSCSHVVRPPHWVHGSHPARYNTIGENLPREVYEDLLNHPRQSVRQLLISSQSCPADIVVEAMNKENPAAASNPTISSEVVAKALTYKDAQMRRAAALNPALNVYAAYDYCGRSDAAVRHALLERSDCPIPMLREVLDAADDDDLCVLAKTPSYLPHELFDEMVHRGKGNMVVLSGCVAREDLDAANIRSIVEETKDKPMAQRMIWPHLAAKPVCPTDSYAALAEIPECQVQIAARRDADEVPGLLERLADSDNKMVRMAIARRTDLTPEVTQVLLKYTGEDETLAEEVHTNASQEVADWAKLVDIFSMPD